MTGPEHYSEAEKLLDDAYRVGPEESGPWIAKAQAHAILALVAATYTDPYFRPQSSEEVFNAWLHQIDQEAAVGLSSLKSRSSN